MANLFNFFQRKTNSSIKPVVLLSLDGWGIAPTSAGNAVAQAHIPNLNSYRNLYPYTQLIASGESVGLPANEVGNSEVGHLIMGAGRVIYQSLTRISISIERRDFFRNTALIDCISYVRNHKSKLHIAGLIGSGNVHASVSHLYALLDLCQQEGVTKVYLHLFTDGRDGPPKEAETIISEIEQRIKLIKLGTIASICGRYYAMDRDGRWQRTQKAYEMMVAGVGQKFQSPQAAIKAAYEQGLSDEFIEPSLISPVGSENTSVSDTDGIIFFNFRHDRMRQLAMSFTLADFEQFNGFSITEPGGVHGKRIQSTLAGPTFIRSKKLQQLFITSMTEYHKQIPVQAVAYPLTSVDMSCSEVIAQKGLAQQHLAESEKETMVSYYFDGLREVPFVNEDVLIIQSPRVPMYDKKPDMSVYKIVSAFKKSLRQDKYYFYMINFANPDMVAHTGNLQATLKALEHTDKAVGEVVDAVLAHDGTVFVTADHGNAEELLTYPTRSFFYTTQKGKINTDHSNNPVPFHAISNNLKGLNKQYQQGSLSDVAPTILTRLGLPIPTVMTGKNLLE